MEALLSLVRNFVGDENAAATVFIIMAAAAIFVFTLGVSLLVLALAHPLRRRLRRLGPQGEKADTSRAESISALIQPLAGYVMPKEDWKRTKISRQLVQAGYRSPDALNFFYGCRVVLIVALPLILLVLWHWFPAVSSRSMLFYLAIAVYFAVILPGAILDRLVLNRMRKLRKGFPDALDLMVVCVESGLGLAAAIQRVSDELAVSHPELANELSLVNAEMRAGVERGEALKHLADRTGLEDIRGLVALLIQTMRFGTSVADALRVYSEEFRDKRMQAAEETAAKIGTKMIFPLIVCMFPSFFLVAIGPAVIRLIDAFKHMGSVMK